MASPPPAARTVATLKDGRQDQGPENFPFHAEGFASRSEWAARREEVLLQLRVSQGIHPMPSRPPIAATVHSKVEEGDYSVESVFFQSSPGLYVTGSLFRPTGPSLPKESSPGLPCVMCPYGHWEDGRFYDQGDDGVAEQIAKGAEDFPRGGRCPLQARCVGLARLGCVVFMYDMLGRADGTATLSDYVTHGFSEPRPSMEMADRWGLYSPQAEGQLISTMGLFTWNSIRTLDWICTLPGIDTERIGCTGASGGGTQTFVLAALDERISAAFPCVMVGCAMQGGCTCENCSLLRIGTGNVEIAATIAPRPLGMTVRHTLALTHSLTHILHTCYTQRETHKHRIDYLLRCLRSCGLARSVGRYLLPTYVRTYVPTYLPTYVPTEGCQ